MGLNYGKRFRTSGSPIPLDGVERQKGARFNPLRHFGAARQRIKAASATSRAVDLVALDKLLSEAWTLAQNDLRAGRKRKDAIAWDARVRRENEQLRQALTLLRDGEKGRAAETIVPRRRYRRLSGPLRITHPSEAKTGASALGAPATAGKASPSAPAPHVRRVDLGDWVVVRFDAGGRRQRFRIAPTPGSRLTTVTVLATSPVGVALLDSRVGDTVALPTSSGVTKATVVSISDT